MKKILISLLLAATAISAMGQYPIRKEKIADDIRAGEVADMRFGAFVCWSFSTFSGKEWTGEQHTPDVFAATGCDTDQWVKTMKEAGMNYILFLAKHHDGFCLWDTATTDLKVTNSPLGIDVLAKLKKSCDKYGLKLALYFSEGDWNWPEAERGAGGKGGNNPDAKRLQLKELLTNYGDIEFIWFDHAAGDGGLSHEQTTAWVHLFQPNCFAGYNHGEPSGRLCLRERGKAGRLGDSEASAYNKEQEASYKGYLVAEFTYPLLPAHEGGADWFYSLPQHDGLAYPASKIYEDYCGAVEFNNIFSLNLGPDYSGRLRDIDVKVLREVGKMIRATEKK